MDLVAFLPEDFERLKQMRLRLHNAQKSMTFDEQRDFAERLRLLLQCSQKLTIPDPPAGPQS